MSDDLNEQLARLWTLCQFDSHVTDWLAQLSKTDAQKQHQKQYEDAFLVFDKTDELLDERQRIDELARKSSSPLEIEAAARLISKLDEKTGSLYQSIGFGPDGKTPAAPVMTVSASVTHSTKARRDTLTPVIELAQKQCNNPKDTAEVWAVLQGLAENKSPPLIGATENGLQYLKGGAAANLTRDALGKRLAR